MTWLSWLMKHVTTLLELLPRFLKSAGQDTLTRSVVMMNRNARPLSQPCNHLYRSSRLPTPRSGRQQCHTVQRGSGKAVVNEFSIARCRLVVSPDRGSHFWHGYLTLWQIPEEFLFCVAYNEHVVQSVYRCPQNISGQNA